MAPVWSPADARARRSKTDRPDRRRVDDTPHAVTQARVQNVFRAGHIALEDFFRTIGPERVLGGDVIDVVAAAHGGTRGIRIAKIALGHLDVKPLKVAAIRSAANENAYGMPAF